MSRKSRILIKMCRISGNVLQTLVPVPMRNTSAWILRRFERHHPSPFQYDDACVKILDEAGFLPMSGIATVDLLDIPHGLSARETERFLRDNGARICGPRLAPSADGVGSA